MEEPLGIDELHCELMVNGMPVRSVQIRCVPDSTDNFQLVITHPTLGPFALHDGFELEVRERDSWRPLTLEWLKKTLAAQMKSLHAQDIPKSSKIAERRLFAGLDDFNVPYRRSPRLSGLTGHAECVRHVRKVLLEAGVPHRVAGTVFVVPSSLKARTCLIRLGFEKARSH